jgi:DNA-binding XRE family transcriptional regulator
MNRLEQFRYERGLTQQEVASGAGISRQTVVSLEQRAEPKPSVVVAGKLAEFYGLTVSELLGLDVAA